MQILTSVLFFLVFASQAFSANPITHIYLTEQWLQFNSTFTEKQASAFIVGNLYPDIEYLETTKIAETHLLNVTLDDIDKAPDAFTAGVLLHSYVDEQRDDIIAVSNIYNCFQEVASSGHLDTLLKLVEDEMIYDKIDVLATFNALQKFPLQEKKQGLTMQDLQEWHLFLSLYISVRPSDIIKYLADTNETLLDVPAETVKLWNKHFIAFTQKPEVKAYVEELTQNFSNEFELHSLLN